MTRRTVKKNKYRSNWIKSSGLCYIQGQLEEPVMTSGLKVYESQQCDDFLST